VRLVCRGDQKFRIEDVCIAVFDVIQIHGIHVVDDWTIIDLVTLNPQVTRLVSSDNMLSNQAPLSRRVETLVDIPLETESRDPDLSSDA
jgi:hypothetical protein